jgi:putative transposase
MAPHCLCPFRDGRLGRRNVRSITEYYRSEWLRYIQPRKKRGRGSIRRNDPRPLFFPRFKSLPVADDEHFLVVCRYVERNPLRANLVERAEDWKFGSLWQWARKAEPVKLLSAWPIPRTAGWIDRVNQPLSEKELATLRTSVQRGRPFGEAAWTAEVAERTESGYTLRPRGRPRKAAK